MTGSRPAVGRVGFGDAVCESGRVLRAEALERSRREFERRSRRGRRSAARGTGIGDLNPAQAPEYVGQTQVVVRPEVRRMKVAEARGLERSNRFDRLPLRRLVVLRGSPAARVEREHVWRQTVSFDPEPAGLRAVGRPPSGRSCSDPGMLAKIRAIQASDRCTYRLPPSPCCPAGIRRALEPRGGASLMAAAGFGMFIRCRLGPRGRRGSPDRLGDRHALCREAPQRNTQRVRDVPPTFYTAGNLYSGQSRARVPCHFRRHREAWQTCEDQPEPCQPTAHGHSVSNT